jgi:XTP/dITP diphosphohydrolase
MNRGSAHEGRSGARNAASGTPGSGCRLLVATRNAGKLHELEPMLRAAGFDPIDPDAAGIPPDDAEEMLEVEDTFSGNALAKARWFHARSGLPALADDSGLSVRALGGAPGVRSKRFSGRTDLRGRELDAANNAALLEQLGDRSDTSAAFVCAAAFVDAGVELVAEGRVEGRIVEARGGEYGFGYDPHFLSDELGVTFAEADREAKERVSHRGRAVRALLAKVEASGWGANAEEGC